MPELELTDAPVLDGRASDSVGALTISGLVTRRWDTFAIAPNPAAIADLLGGAAMQRLLLDPAGRVQGLVQLHDIDLISAHGGLGIVLADSDPVRRAALGHVHRFVGDAFRAFPLRRVYLELASSMQERWPELTEPPVRHIGSLDAHVRRGPEDFEAMEIHMVDEADGSAW